MADMVITSMCEAFWFALARFVSFRPRRLAAAWYVVRGLAFPRNYSFHLYSSDTFLVTLHTNPKRKQGNALRFLACAAGWCRYQSFKSDPSTMIMLL
jgi:hypothetical protein